MSVQREIDWRERFDRPIKVKGRRALIKTRAEAGLFILDELPSGRQHRQAMAEGGESTTGRRAD